MAPVTNQQIFEKLGELSAGQDHARESRHIMHERMDKHEVLLNETVKTLSNVQFASEVTAGVVAQLRSKMDVVEKAVTVSETFQKEVEPFLGLLKNIRLSIWVLTGVLSAGGVTTIGALTFFGDWAKELVKSWIGI